MIGAGVPSEDSDPIDLTPQSAMILEDFPSKPGKPRALTVTDSSIQLEWDKPEKGVECITSYAVLYHAQFTDPPDQWTEVRMHSSKESIIVSDLYENTTYLFQVLPECKNGIELESDISDPVTTKMIMPSRPGKPQVICITHDSVELK